ESLYTVLSGHAVAYDQLGIPGKRTGSRTPGSAPRNVYRTKDDRWIAIAGSTQAITERLFKEMGRDDLLSDPRFKTNRDRVANVEAVDEVVSAWVAGRTQAECIERLVKAEVAVAPVYDFKQLAEDPHLSARKTLVTLEDPELGILRMPDVLPKLSETPGKIRHAGLPMGAHNDEVYRDRLGLSDDEMRSLKAEGVI
ncbi:MAG TPA: CoA transferase, partial [Methyloceanibacter sp.]|nr:CoA transferase [Methyloceanibacter sp.]